MQLARKHMEDWAKGIAAGIAVGWARAMGMEDMMGVGGMMNQAKPPRETPGLASWGWEECYLITAVPALCTHRPKITRT